LRRGLLRLLCSVIMGEAEPSRPSVTADWQTRYGRRQRLHYLGNTRSIVPPGQRIALASATSMRTSTYHNECSGGRGLLRRPSGLVYVSVLVGTCRLRTTPRRASTSSLSEGSGYYTGGPGPHEGSGTPGCSGCPPLPGHVSSLDLSQS